MTIASTTNRITYTGNGAVDTYAYTFKIFDDDDLLVTVKDTASPPVETTLVKTTDYTVTGVGETSGGNVVLVNAAQSWLDGDGDLLTNYVLTIRRVVTLTQDTDIRNQGSFYPETHEDALDSIVMMTQQLDDDNDRSAKLPETLTSSDFDPELPTDIGTADRALIVNATGDGFTMGPSAAEISGAEGHATNAQNWATKTDGIVESTDYSSKAWSIGGTDVTDTSGRGASKEWATKTSSSVDTSEFSSKEYAQGSQSGTGGSAKNWAQQTGADVAGASSGDMSAKEWAVGTLGRGVAGEGSSKDWATHTSGTVDDAEYSSKAWSVGGTGVTDTSGRGASKEWATKTSSTVDSSEFSSKEYAQGSQAGTGGSSKNWATQTGADVTGASAGDMSAKEWAVGTLGRGVAGEGSSKDWATYTSGTVDGSEYSSKYHAQQASSSAASAAASAALQLFKQTDFLTNAGSPYTLTNADLGILKSIDASSGNVVVNLPEISTFGGAMAAVVLLRTDSGSNTVTINRAGSDTIGSGAASSITLDSQDHGAILAPEDSTSPDQWSHLDINNPAQKERTVTTVTGTTHNLSDSDDVVILDASSNAITVNLHAVAAARAKPYTFIVKDNTNTITLDPNSTETINGQTTVDLYNKYQAVDVIPDGSAWYIKARGLSAPDMSCTFARCVGSGTNGGSLYSSSYLDSQFSHYQGDDMFTSGPITAGTLTSHHGDSHTTLGTWNIIPGKTTGNAFTTFDFAPGIYRLKFSKGTSRKGCKVRIYDNDGATALRYGNTVLVVSDTNDSAWSTVEATLILTTANEYSFEFFIGGGGTANGNARGIPLGDGVCETYATVDVEYWEL